jgi:hypothetical protein
VIQYFNETRVYLAPTGQGPGQNGRAALSPLYMGLQKRLPGLRLFTHSIIWSGEVKYLGITFDVKLLWNKNIYKVANKTLASCPPSGIPQYPFTSLQTPTILDMHLVIHLLLL